MTLPSQFARATSRHNHMFRRRRGNRRVFLGVLVATLIGVFALWRITISGGDAPASALASAGDAVEIVEEAPPQEMPANPSLARDPQPRSTTPPPSREPERTSQSATSRQQAVTSTPEKAREPEIRMGESLPSSVTSPNRVALPETPRETTSTPAQPQREQAEPSRTTTATTAPATPAQQRAQDRIRVGMELLASNRPIEGRVALTRALDSGMLDAATARRVRETLTELNDRLVFSPEVVEGDPFTFGYTIRSGDALSRLPRGQNLATDWRLIQRVNRIVRPEAIRAGQRIKLVSGPFHAVVYKRQFRMDIYMGDGADRVFVRSMPVGLGEYDSTPVGTFKVRPNSKLINPEWVNPRTGERFLPDDPKNPIGEHWIGLVGVSEGVRDLGGYGIHGTIEPHTIGQQASMGCIRMHAEHVELVYELLVEEHSTIEIVDL